MQKYNREMRRMKLKSDWVRLREGGELRKSYR